MGLHGDFGPLRRMVRRVKGLRSPGFRKQLCKQLSAEALSRVQECFQTGKDPYGKPWAPLKSRKGQPLRDTGRLMNSIRRRSYSASGFIIGSNVKYAAIHNFGGTIKHAARTELRAYSGGRKRKRLSLYSKRKNRVRTVAEIPEHTSSIPTRQFVPESDRLPKAWRLAFQEIFALAHKRWVNS